MLAFRTRVEEAPHKLRRLHQKPTVGVPAVTGLFCTDAGGVVYFNADENLCMLDGTTGRDQVVAEKVPLVERRESLCAIG
jgi:hypothetical protein